MTREELIQKEFIDDILQWPAQKIYNLFGPRLETIVNQQKEILQLELKIIWKNKKYYCFRETGEQLDADAMLFFFNPKKVRSYSLEDLETIKQNIERDTHTN